MQAAIYSRSSKQGICVKDVARPRVTRWHRLLHPQWVECQVKAAGVNPVDAKFLYGDKLPERFTPFVQRCVEGRISGLDFSGVVTQAAPESGFNVGDEVFGTVPPFICGSFSEYLWAPTDSISHKPASLNFEQAAALPLVSLTALQAFENHGIQNGQHVLIIGASGGTGHFAVQIAKQKGARVSAICSRRNRDFVQNMGADTVICYDQCNDVIESLTDIVNQEGQFDLVFDSVSSHDTRDAAFQYESSMRLAPSPLLRPNSVYILIGGQLKDWFFAHVKRFFGINLFGSHRELFWIVLPKSAERLKRIRQMVDAGDLKVTIDQTFNLTSEGLQAAFAALNNRRTVGKIVITIDK